MKTTLPPANPIPHVPDRMRSDGWWLVSEPASPLAAGDAESVVVSAMEDRADDYRQHDHRGRDTVRR